MNRRSSPLLALVAAGCGAGQTTPPPAAPAIEHARVVPIDVEPALDLDRGARMWRALAPTGADYVERLAAVAEPELRREMAVALLRQGDLACAEYVEEWGCSDSYLVMAPLDPAATLENPCLRRVLALWALEQLEPEDARALTDVLVDLTSMPSPEHELPDAAFAAAPDDGTRLRMLAAAPDEYQADSWSSQLETDAARVRAITGLHLVAPIDQVEIATHRDALRGALVDRQLDAYARGRLLEGFVDDDDPRTTRALQQLALDADCALAVRAATLLAERGDASYLPVRPRMQDPQASLRALCLMQATDTPDASFEGFVSDDGYDSATIPANGWYDEHDAYHPPEPDEAHVELDEAVFDDRLVAHAWTCDGLTCTSSEQGWRDVTVTFAHAPDGGLHLARVSSTENEGEGGCGC